MSNLDNLGESYDPWSPGELGLVLKSTGSCGVEWDLGYEPFTVLSNTVCDLMGCAAIECKRPSPFL